MEKAVHVLKYAQVKWKFWIKVQSYNSINENLTKTKFFGSFFDKFLRKILVSNLEEKNNNINISCKAKRNAFETFLLMTERVP